jgi:hypothetical protein
MNPRLTWNILFLCGALVAAGCGDDTTTPPDTGGPKKDGLTADLAPPDAAVPDLAPPDGAVPDQTQPDTRMWPDQFVPDKMPPDTVMWPDLVKWTPDAAVISGPGVVYTTGSSSSSMTVKRVKSDGTGKVTVAGVENPYYYYYTYQTGRRPYPYMTDRSRPAPAPNVYTYYRPHYLPNNLGHLYYYRTASSASTQGTGFFVVRPDGKAEKLVLTPPSGSTSVTSTSYNYYYYIGARDDGSMIAAAHAYGQTDKAKVHLIRTDGRKWSKTGTYLCDVSPTKTGELLDYVYYNSLTFGEKNIYFVGRDGTRTSTSQYDLFRAPLDCSAPASKVTLPKVGSSEATYFDYYMTTTEDGKKLFFRAGTSSSNVDIFVVDDATGKATNVSDSPKYYCGPGYYQIYYSYSSTAAPRADITPDGKYVAYMEYSSPYQVYVRPVDKSKAAVGIKTSTDFSSSATYTGNIRWLNNDQLMFWVGSSSSYYDMFIYSISSGKVTQKTTSGGTTKPYSGGSSIRAYYGWDSPNRKYIYYIQYKSGSPTTYDIKAVERATGKIINVTTGMYVYYSYMWGAPNSSNLFFVGYTAGSSPYQYNMYYFDQNAAKTPVKLSSHTGSSYWYIYDASPSADGTKVAYTGYSTSSQQTLFVATTTTPPVVYQMTATPTSTHYVSELSLISPDGKSVAYGIGSSSSSQMDIRVQTIGTSTTAKVVESTTGYGGPMMFYK